MGGGREAVYWGNCGEGAWDKVGDRVWLVVGMGLCVTNVVNVKKLLVR